MSLTIHKKYQLDFPKQQLFEAWVSPDTIIPPVDKIEVDPKEGGFLRLIVHMPDNDSIMHGQFLTYNPPDHLVYTWEWDNDGEVSQIEVTFEELDNGRTEITIIHSGFTHEESRVRHDSGWDTYVEGVVQLLQAA